MDFPHTKSAEELFKYFNVSEERGLSNAIVEKQQEQYGLNGNENFSCLNKILLKPTVRYFL